MSLIGVGALACALAGVFAAPGPSRGAETSPRPTVLSTQGARTLRSPERVKGLPAASCQKTEVNSVLHQVHAAGKPLAVMVGASITAGWGATCLTDSWPYLLAQRMGWRLAVRGIGGVGYVRTTRRGGPLLNELIGLHVFDQHPFIVVLQAGHNDVGEPRTVLARHVAATVGLVHRAAPQAKVVLVTVFPGGPPTNAQRRTDVTIVSTAKKTDPQALIVDPIAQGWHYKTIRDHLHPTDAGYRWIARRIEIDLQSHGVSPHRL